MATDAWSSSGGLIQGIVPHTQGGSWYNPLNYDFGFSELAQGAGNAVGNFLFGSPVYAATPEGGSNLFGGNQAQAPAPSPTQTTQTSPTNTQTTGTGGTGTGSIGTLPGTNTNTNTGSSGPNQLDLAYQNYFNYLDQVESGLAPQRSQQEATVNDIYSQNKSTLDTQKANNLNQLSNAQSKSLTDLGDYLRQSFIAGNNALGARGASDSSAARQYAFALSKVASQNRGDITSKFAELQNNLQTTYTTELNNLNVARSQQLSDISQWFANAQNSVRGMRADAQVQKSQEALSYALQAADRVNQGIENQKAALQTWVLNRANSLSDAIKGFGQINSQAPTFSGFNTALNTNRYNGPTLFGYSNDTTDKTQPIFT